MPSHGRGVEPVRVDLFDRGSVAAGVAGCDAWLDEGAPLQPSWVSDSALAAEDETARFARSGARGVSLRYAAFYAPYARSSRDAVRLARRVRRRGRLRRRAGSPRTRARARAWSR